MTPAPAAQPHLALSAPHTGPAAVPNAVLRVPPAAPADAAAYFAASLAFHADVSDVAAALAAGGDPGFTLVDTRSTASWDQGHIPGAVHLPTALIPERADLLLDRARPVVVYCWGPGCNGATRAAFALATDGYQVKEMLGGMEYWIREGFGYATAGGPARRDADPLTAPSAPAAPDGATCAVGAVDCGC
ncbi:rhodanese-like domain-containing protein [Actinacidiphila rubida]|uniref:Rhodanese-related sulfurtransferase n=1 Tax=Actinacidiphila rubida TaxID=310780 RepID=A0A1H8NGB8_9ACTN|nr:rhodanese-like domain-containing protein [Actinacidiphila rubida]SEO28443.1 Rhodanese-related sulfurtransferase [Actinacidiphila rubida]